MLYFQNYVVYHQLRVIIKIHCSEYQEFKYKYSNKFILFNVELCG